MRAIEQLLSFNKQKLVTLRLQKKNRILEKQ